LTMNYTSEQLKEGLDSTSQYLIAHVNNGVHQHYVLPHLSCHSDLLPGLTNDLQGTYIHSTYSENDLQQGQEVFADTTEFANQTQYKATSYHLWMRDRLGYNAVIGRWNIEPAINGTYEHFNERYNDIILQTNSISGGLPFNTTTDEFAYGAKANLLILTPAVDIRYSKALDVQGGVQVYAGHQAGVDNRRGFPFASLSVDVLKWGHEARAEGLSIYGSYAQRSVMSLQGYTLADLTPASDIGAVSFLPGSFNLLTLTGGQSVYITPSGVPTPVYWVWETGASYTGWKDRLRIGYTFEQRNFVEDWLLIEAGGYFALVYPEGRSSLQHADIRVTVLDGEGLRWQSGVNATLLRNKFNSLYTGYPNALGKQDVGDDSPAAASWTGGWVNRVQVKHFTAGFDLLYHFGETVIHPSNGQTVADTVKVNSVITPNIYIGYSWHLQGVRVLELFVESRGLIRNSANDLLDDRRYYTVGGKMSI